jgi:hypothetical protein
MMGEAPRVGRDQCRAVAGEADDAVDARGLDGFSAVHRGQDGGMQPCQHRLACPGRAKEEHVMVRTPAGVSTRHYGV